MRSIRGILTATFAALLVAAPVLADPVGLDPTIHDPAWIARHTSAGPRNDQLMSALVSPDGSTVLAGGTTVLESPGSFRDSNLTFDYSSGAWDAATGSLVWNATQAGPAGRDDWVVDVAISPDGEVLVETGCSESTRDLEITDHPVTVCEWLTIARDAATGEVVWTAREGDGEGPWGLAVAVEVSPDGETVVVAGDWRVDAQDPTGAVTVGYDRANGDPLWRDRTDSPGRATALAEDLAMGPDGTAFMTARTETDATHRDFAIVAVDAADGTRRWTARWDGPGSLHDIPWAIGVSKSTDRVVVAGATETPGIGQDDIQVVAWEVATGQEAWSTRLPLTVGTDTPTDLAVGPDGGRIVVTGRTIPALFGTFAEGNDYGTVALDPDDGSLLWYARWDSGPLRGSSTCNDDIPWAVGIDPEGSTVVVTGQTQDQNCTGPFHDKDVATVAYDADDGKELWQHVFDGPASGADEGADVVVGPDRAYAVGYSQDDASWLDQVMLAYDLDGPAR